MNIAPAILGKHADVVVLFKQPHLQGDKVVEVERLLLLQGSLIAEPRLPRDARAEAGAALLLVEFACAKPPPLGAGEAAEHRARRELFRFYLERFKRRGDRPLRIVAIIHAEVPRDANRCAVAL